MEKSMRRQIQEKTNLCKHHVVSDGSFGGKNDHSHQGG